VREPDERMRRRAKGPTGLSRAEGCLTRDGKQESALRKGPGAKPPDLAWSGSPGQPEGRPRHLF